MWNSIKLYIYGSFAAIGMFVVLRMKHLSGKVEKLEDEVKVANKNNEILVQQNFDKKVLDTKVAKVVEEAKVIQNEINEKRDKKIKPKPTDMFGDKRL